jgi:uncharacterized protein YjbI with pentapeptide repeats
LYSTASYQAHDLTGIQLGSLSEAPSNYIAGWNFAGQDMASATFQWAIVTGANFSRANLANTAFNGNFLVNTDLSLADTRGSQGMDLTGAILTNTIRPDGQVIGLDLSAGQTLVVRNNNGNSTILPPLGPIGISVSDHLTMGAGTLSLSFDADPWNSLISFAPGIPVSLAGGTLELTFREGVDPAGQVGRVFHVFEWTGVSPTGELIVSSSYRWDISRLYTDGDVTMTAVPEPSTVVLAIPGVIVLLASRRRR